MVLSLLPSAAAAVGVASPTAAANCSTAAAPTATAATPAAMIHAVRFFMARPSGLPGLDRLGALAGLGGVNVIDIHQRFELVKIGSGIVSHTSSALKIEC